MTTSRDAHASWDYGATAATVTWWRSTWKRRAARSRSELGLLMWKQTDKAPFRDITINYFKWSQVRGRRHYDFSAPDHHELTLIVGRLMRQLLAEAREPKEALLTRAQGS